MNRRILAVGAHPDDIEIGCGGTLGKLQRTGAELIFVIATFGEQGSRSRSTHELKTQRAEEARRAAEILGASQTIFLGEPDGLTNYSPSSRLELISLLRRFRPDTVFTHARSDCFTDHRIVNELTESALMAAAGPWYAESQGLPHRVPNIYGYEVWNPITRPEAYSNITETLELKIEALAAHRSQMSELNYIDAIKGLARYRGIMSAQQAGLPDAEAFEVLRSPDLY